MPNKNILIISSTQILPTMSGATLHTAGMAKTMADQGHKVQIYCMAGRQENYSLGKTRREQSTRIAPRLSQEINLTFMHGAMQGMARRLGMPHVWHYYLMRFGWVPAPLKAAVDWADVVFCDMAHCHPLPARMRKQPWILISHDLVWRQLQQGTTQQKLWSHWMKRVEAAAPQIYDDIVAVTEEDRGYFLQQPRGPELAMPIVGSGVDPSSYELSASMRAQTRAELGVADDEHLILFSGSNFGPNITALANIRAYFERNESWLAEKRIRLLLLGSIEPEAYSRGRYIATGRVDSIEPYFAAADAGFNPIVSGSGANVKLFEYLATRLPVISTEFGVRGSELQAGTDYIQCDATDFTPAFEKLLSKSREQWADDCESIWQRHKHYCDIREQTRAALKQLPGFDAADS